MTPEEKEVLQRIHNTSYGKALASLLNFKLKELNDVTTVKSWDETLGRQHATRILKEIFRFIEEPQTSSSKRVLYD